MNLSQSYKILQVNDSATDEAVAAAYKRLAREYHPDKNRNKVEWANKAMTDLNSAYSIVMAYRFQHASVSQSNVFSESQTKRAEKQSRDEEWIKKVREAKQKEAEREHLINQFVKERERAKDALYRYFQYNLFNIARRESGGNRVIFQKIVKHLRQSYHGISELLKVTEDEELKSHFSVFNTMTYHFYRASECANILDSYNDQTEVDAFRFYKTGDEALHLAHREIFYDRHNRGSFKEAFAWQYIEKGEMILKHTISGYSKTSWAVETQIKLEYLQSLKAYLALFFSEE